MVAVKCHACGKSFSLEDGSLSNRVECPACKSAIDIQAERVADCNLPTVPLPTPRAEAELPTASTSSPVELTHDSDSKSAGHDPALAAFLAPKQSDDELGRLGGYRILNILGHGGMGVVFLGEDPKLRRKVAIKTMLPHLAARAMDRERFLREARSAAALEHDHIVPILHVGEDQGVPFIVMPFLRGQSLEDRLKSGPLSVAELVLVARQAASALAFAHAHGVVHRDIKPANLWFETRMADVTLPDGPTAPPGEIRVKVLDFGLAQLTAHDELNLTQTGAMLGTAGYMAPEQADGRDVDGKADVFSLGCTLYRSATGQAAFPGETLMARLARLATVTPPSIEIVKPETPRAISELVDRMLTKPTGPRPTAVDVLKALSLAASAETAEATLTLPAVITAPPAASKKEPSVFTVREGLDRPLDGTSPVLAARRLGGRKALFGAAAAIIVATLASLPFFWRRDTGQPIVLPDASNKADKAPLRGEIDVVVWRKNDFDPVKKILQHAGYKLHQPGALPMAPGDWMRIEVELNRPAYCYVIWIDTEGHFTPFYPWRDMDWKQRPASETTVARLTLPEKQGDIAPLGPGPAGMETLLLLTRDDPLPADFDLNALVKLPPQKSADPRSAVWFENGSIVRHEVNRGPIQLDQAVAANSVVTSQNLLHLQLKEMFPYSRAVSFANRGD